MSVAADHWLTRIRRLPSPNCDARGEGERPELVIVHCISLPPGRFGNGLVEALFLNRLDTRADPALADLDGVRVSAHLFIDRRGRATQFVPFDRRAWHAGLSSWRGRPSCNRFSIGIELEGTDTGRYTAAQYTRLGRVLADLFDRYPGLGPDAVVGHQEVAPDRKRDPGPGFDWRRVLLPLARR
ncbi:MAG: 1,6-anhydro-N-acetylmuramyl-L-alanine amidase AmpD [Pseudomonadales bacterium]|nr:1,6-anhydro-N-acetylmuramyl-L-alanine amidase AmpD [Pseudomonadales bacterium]